MIRVHVAAALTGVIVAVMCGAGCEGDNGVPPRPVKPAPTPPRQPCPPDGPCPRWPTGHDASPWERSDWADVIGAFVNSAEHDGIHIFCDLDPSLHTRNVGGSDGAGLCVFASMKNIGEYQHNSIFTDVFDVMKGKPGGGWPSKVDREISLLCRQRGVDPPDYIQVMGRDPALTERAVQAGLMVGTTYNHSPSGRYGGQRIAHMVNLVHADGANYVILDNNYPGGSNYEWLSREEWLSTRPDWSIILLESP